MQDYKELFSYLDQVCERDNSAVYHSDYNNFINNVKNYLKAEHSESQMVVKVTIPASIYLVGGTTPEDGYYDELGSFTSAYVSRLCEHEWVLQDIDNVDVYINFKEDDSSYKYNYIITAIFVIDIQDLEGCFYDVNEGIGVIKEQLKSDIIAYDCSPEDDGIFTRDTEVLSQMDLDEYGTSQEDVYFQASPETSEVEVSVQNTKARLNESLRRTVEIKKPQRKLILPEK